MKLSSLILLFIFFLLVPSCIDPIDFSKGDDSKRLVVDGLITNEPGPYVVYLASTSSYNAFTTINESVEGAIVILSDDQGDSETLTESYIPGIYKTDPDGLQGVPGRYYKIEIETSDGKQYESIPELLTAVPDIDTVYYERQEVQELDDDNSVKTFEGFQIYMDTSDPENVANYYMWSWAGTHEVHTQPWLYSDGMVFAPKDCCATCWVTEISGQIDLSNDNFINGNQITKRPVTFVRIKTDAVGRHFRGKYHMEVRQLSLTKAAYNYWSLIKDQINSSGSTFDPPPSAITGNITDINEPENTAFGYFGASAVATKSIFIPAREAPYQPDDTLEYPDDCRAMGSSTHIMPSFW